MEYEEKKFTIFSRTFNTFFLKDSTNQQIITSIVVVNYGLQHIHQSFLTISANLTLRLSIECTMPLLAKYRVPLGYTPKVV